MNIKKNISILLFLLGIVTGAKAQNVALKTNLLSDAILSPNAGLEFRLAPRWSFDLSGQYNDWAVNDHKWKHWLVQPELRYWFCDAFAGHFIGLHALGGEYNYGNFDSKLSFFGTDYSIFKNERHQGWYIGAGIAWGYAVILSRHWNFEFELGIGYVYTHYDTYKCEGCGKKIDEDKSHNYFGPTKVAMNLVYEF